MFWYNFDKVLYHFLETGTSDKTLICLNQLLKFSGSSLYTQLHFSFTVPLNSFLQSHPLWETLYELVGINFVIKESGSFI